STPLQQVDGDVYGESEAAQQAGIAFEEPRQDASPAVIEVSQPMPAVSAGMTSGVPPTLDNAPAPPQTDEPKDSKPDLLTGEAGRILAGLLESLESGKRQWGRDALLDDGKHLLIRWPDAVSDCGLPMKSILDE